MGRHDVSHVKPDELFVKDVKFAEKNAFGDNYRNYEDSARQSVVQENYRKSHTLFTVDRVEELHQKWIHNLGAHGEFSCMEVLDLLDLLVDDSDPDVDIPNSLHAYMTAEAIREAYPDEKWDWFWLTGLLHDLGKVMSVWGEEQWCVVGDTFPVGCRFSEKNVFPEFFSENPDAKHVVYGTENGAYAPNCGLAQMRMSFGHDEYMFQVLSQHLTNKEDEETTLPWIREFNKFDLYSKGDSVPDPVKLKPMYQALMDKYGIGGKLRW